MTDRIRLWTPRGRALVGVGLASTLNPSEAWSPAARAAFFPRFVVSAARLASFRTGAKAPWSSAPQENRHSLDELAGVCYCFSELCSKAALASPWAPRDRGLGGRRVRRSAAARSQKVVKSLKTNNPAKSLGFAPQQSQGLTTGVAKPLVSFGERSLSLSPPRLRLPSSRRNWKVARRVGELRPQKLRKGGVKLLKSLARVKLCAGGAQWAPGPKFWPIRARESRSLPFAFEALRTLEHSVRRRGPQAGSFEGLVTRSQGRVPSPASSCALLGW